MKFIYASESPLKNSKAELNKDNVLLINVDCIIAARISKGEFIIILSSFVPWTDKKLYINEQTYNQIITYGLLR